MERRALLSMLGASAATLAGCTGRFSPGDDLLDPGDDSPAGSPTARRRRVSMGRSVTVDGATLTVANPRVRPTVMQNLGVWQDIRVPDGQFLVVDVTTDGAFPGHLDDVTLTGAVGGEPLPGGGPVRVVGADGPRASPSPGQWEGYPVAFPFPAGAHEAARVRWERDGTTARWTLGESVRSTLASEPRFRVEELSAYRTDEDDVALDLTVANEGDRDARFQARVSFEAISDASSTVTVEVPAGGTASYVDVPPVLAYGGVETVTTAFRTGGERRQTTLSVPPAREPTTASADGATSSGTDDRTRRGGDSGTRTATSGSG